MRKHAPCEVDRFASVRYLAGNVHVVLGGNERAEAAAHGGLIVGQQNADHAILRYGNSAATRNPSGAGAACNVPPTVAARSFIPMMPTPRPAPLALEPARFSMAPSSRSCS